MCHRRLQWNRIESRLATRNWRIRTMRQLRMHRLHSPGCKRYREQTRINHESSDPLQAPTQRGQYAVLQAYSGLPSKRDARYLKQILMITREAPARISGRSCLCDFRKTALRYTMHSAVTYELADTGVAHVRSLRKRHDDRKAKT